MMRAFLGIAAAGLLPLGAMAWVKAGAPDATQKVNAAARAVVRLLICNMFGFLCMCLCRSNQ